MPLVRLSVLTREWVLRSPFIISRQTIERIETIEVIVENQAGLVGRGAAAGLDYAGETPATMRSQIECVRTAIEAEPDRERLLHVLGPGGARAAVDGAFWDLEAKCGDDPFEANGLSPSPVHSSITIGLRPPIEMEKAARAARDATVLKLKAGNDNPVEMVAAARRGAPNARFIVDPNQAWSVDLLKQVAPKLAELGVELLEQPIPVGAEDQLDGYACPIPLCADESCDSIGDLPKLIGRFQAINIKLDKTGGLTAALQLADAAQAAGFELMVGCMLAPSLAIAPAMVLAQRCNWVDLDAPPFLSEDDVGGFQFEGGLVRQPHKPGLWG